MFEKAGQEVLIAAKRGQRSARLLMKMLNIGGSEIGHATVLDVAPNTFDRIQFE